ncbi:MAG: hypothetical protein ABJD66_16540 [Cellulophaga sp.]|uniref:hypothetical protein n=1 Tax=Cellulophaga sp. TaxID=1972202 RepID=UPI0032647717
MLALAGANKNNLKELWKKAFQNTDTSKGPTKTEIFNNIDISLKQSLFGQNTNTQFQIFESVVNDTNSNLYKFIKAQ